MIGEHWTPGGDASSRLRRLLEQAIQLATAATIDTDDDDDFEGVLGAEDRALVAASIDGLTETLDHAVDHQLGGERFEVTLVGYVGAGHRDDGPAGQSLETQVDGLRLACDRWWTRLVEHGLGPGDPVPHPDRAGMRVDDLVLDVVESVAIAVGEVTALLERRR